MRDWSYRISLRWHYPHSCPTRPPYTLTPWSSPPQGIAGASARTEVSPSRARSAHRRPRRWYGMGSDALRHRLHHRLRWVSRALVPHDTALSATKDDRALHCPVGCRAWSTRFTGRRQPGGKCSSCHTPKRRVPGVRSPAALPQVAVVSRTFARASYFGTECVSEFWIKLFENGEMFLCFVKLPHT